MIPALTTNNAAVNHTSFIPAILPILFVSIDVGLS